MIAILVAVREELAPILRRTTGRRAIRHGEWRFHEGRLAGKNVVLLALGVGKECAHKAAELTARIYRPRLIVSAGFGGGLAENLTDGDIVIGSQVLELEPRPHNKFHCNVIPTPLFRPSPEFAPENVRVNYGKIVTAPVMILRGDDKTQLGKHTQSLAVDMETSAVAVVAAAHRIPFCAIRAIFDTDREDLPERFNRFFVRGRLQAGEIARACLKRPKTVTELMRMARRARATGKNLADFLQAMLSYDKLPH
jgi:nucleoside phosphorylase